MKFLQWNNRNIGNFDVFMIATDQEMIEITSHFKTDLAKGCMCNYDKASCHTKEYYYFFNSSEKVIVPMPKLYFAFGGMYNGYPPYGGELKAFSFNLHEYTLELYKHQHTFS